MSKKLISLANKYSQNWDIIKRCCTGVPDVLQQDNIFVCPICYDRFTSTEFTDKLSLEHVPPKKLGGKARTVTCRRCNTHSGNSLDAALVKEQNFREFTMGVPGASYPGRYAINDLDQIDATIVYSEEGALVIVGDPQRTDPDKLKKVETSLETNDWQNTTFNLHFRLGMSYHAEVASLRIAYLWAFSVFGYGFLFNRHLESIRQQILHPDDSYLPCYGLVDLPSDQAEGINIITKPEGCQAFLIVFKLKAAMGTIRTRGIILPGPGDPGLHVYEYLMENRNFTVQTKIIPDDFDFNKKPFGSLKLWNQLVYGQN